MIVRATAPVRICDLGGWSDTEFAERGSVVNIAVNLRVHVLLDYRPQTPPLPNPEVRIDALDLNHSHVCRVSEIECEGVPALIEAAVSNYDLGGNLHLTVWSDTPPACGLGTSSALGVALIAGLQRAVCGKVEPAHRIVEEAHSLEVDDLGLECGVQDQHAAAYGGVQFMDVCYPLARTSPLQLDPTFLAELDERLLVINTGEARLSSEVHKRVIEQFRAGAPDQVRAIQTLRGCAILGAEALLASDFSGFADAINLNWQAQRALHPSIATADLLQAIQAAERAGCVAAKANGAGGGGTITVLCAPGREFHVRAAVKRAGYTVLPCSITRHGVRAWVAAP